MGTGKIPTTALHGKPKKPENGFDERETIKKSKNNKKSTSFQKSCTHLCTHCWNLELIQSRTATQKYWVCK